MKKNSLLLFLILLLAAALRLVALDRFPAGLNADEAAIGYNAYSLLETGRDEHGVSWPLVFRSFDDYKPAGYFYLVLPFVKLLGPSGLAVRLPSALLGLGSVYLTYLFAKLLFESKQKNPAISPTNIGLLSALLLAVSPWHLHFSRGGWEVNAATFFLLLGFCLFLKAFQKPRLFLASSLCLVASLYTYHSMRIIIPLLGLSLIYIYFSWLKKVFAVDKKILLASAIVIFALSLPLVGQMLSPQGQSRFSGVSVFADQGPLWEALELRRQYRGPALVGKVFYNRYVFYAKRLFQNYLSHYSPRFLFINGDEIARSKVPDVAQSYLFLFPFFFIGLFKLFSLDSPGKKALLAWLLIAPLAASLTFQSPHALRAQNMVIPLSLISALGLYQSFLWLGSKKLLLIVYSFLIFILFGYSLVRYLHRYYIAYPRQMPFAWEYGFDQVADYLKDNYDQYDQIIISDTYDQPYIILAFYLQYPPEKFQQEIVLEPRDQFGFSTVRAFGKLRFRHVDYYKDVQIPNNLIIAIDEDIPQEKIIHTVFSPAGKPLFKFARSN